MFLYSVVVIWCIETGIPTAMNEALKLALPSKSSYRSSDHSEIKNLENISQET